MPEDPAISVRSRSKKAATRLTDRRLVVRSLRPVYFQDDCVALAAAAADRGAAEAAPAPTQLVDQGADDARAGGADRVSEGDRAPVHVDLVLFDAEHSHGVDRHRGERLVDLPEVDVLRRLADLL